MPIGRWRSCKSVRSIAEGKPAERQHCRLESGRNNSTSVVAQNDSLAVWSQHAPVPSGSWGATSASDIVVAGGNVRGLIPSRGHGACRHRRNLGAMGTLQPCAAIFAIFDTATLRRPSSSGGWCARRERSRRLLYRQNHSRDRAMAKSHPATRIGFWTQRYSSVLR
jgi:hypothetical protein